MILEKFTKQPRDVKDYDVTYGDWLAVSGDTIRTVTATVECLSDTTNTSLVCDAIEWTQTFVKFWVSGGTSPHKYKLTFLVQTAGARSDECELIFNVKEV